MNETDNLITLCDEINNGTYKIGTSIVFIVRYPVYREVFAADFRDRIVHHLIMNELMPIFESEFIDNSFSCREGKGVLCGIKTVSNMMYEASNHYTTDAWIAKLDMKSFFMSIDKIRLSRMIDDLIVKKYPDNRKKQKIRELCTQIIMHHPEQDCVKKGDISLWDKLPKRKSLFSVEGEYGLPIGNLTSQIFANYYLTPMDEYILNELGFKYYARYVDDIVIISDDKAKLLDGIGKIDRFAKEFLGISVHPNKRYIQYYKNGVRFIGAIIKPGRKYILNRTKGMFINKLKTKFKHYNPQKAIDFMMCVNSYLGFLRQHSSYNIRKEILTDKSLIGEWLPYINIEENFKKITLKNNPDKINISNIIEDI